MRKTKSPKTGLSGNPQQELLVSREKKIRFCRRSDAGFFDLDSVSGRIIKRNGASETEVDEARAIIKDLNKNWGRATSFIARSGLHKEVRRGDVERAMRWARVFAGIDGPSAAKQYLKGVVFEETRNVELFIKWHRVKPFTFEQMTRQLASSTKKWELPVRAKNKVFIREVAAFVAAKRRLTLYKSVKALSTALRKAHERQDFDTMCRIHWDACQQDFKYRWPGPAAKRFEQALIPIALEVGGWAQVLAENWRSGFHSIRSLIDVLSGVWTEDANEIASSESDDVVEPIVTFPPLEDYIFDVHTRPGRAAYVAGLKQLRPGYPPPSKMDPRWSGMIRGVCWREFAFAQCGLEYKRKRWEEVSIPRKVWRDTIRADGLFYGGLHRRMRFADVPLSKAKGR